MSRAIEDDFESKALHSTEGRMQFHVCLHFGNVITMNASDLRITRRCSFGLKSPAPKTQESTTPGIYPEGNTMPAGCISRGHEVDAPVAYVRALYFLFSSL